MAPENKSIPAGTPERATGEWATYLCNCTNDAESPHVLGLAPCRYKVIPREPHVVKDLEGRMTAEEIEHAAEAEREAHPLFKIDFFEPRPGEEIATDPAEFGDPIDREESIKDALRTHLEGEYRCTLHESLTLSDLFELYVKSHEKGARHPTCDIPECQYCAILAKKEDGWDEPGRNDTSLWDALATSYEDKRDAVVREANAFVSSLVGQKIPGNIMDLLHGLNTAVAELRAEAVTVLESAES